MATALTRQEYDQAEDRTKAPFLRRVRIRGYKSIALCDVALQPLTVLVGRNNSGKSNFLDALAFLRDAMRYGIADAIHRRGSLSSILCQSAPGTDVTVEVETGFTDPRAGAEYVARYGLTIPAKADPPVRAQERLLLRDVTGNREAGFRSEEDGPVWWGDESLRPSAFPVIHGRDLPLLGVLGHPPFVLLAERLRQMGFYNFHPEAIRRLQTPSPGWPLDRDGSNLASVVTGLKETEDDTFRRVQEYLSAIAEEVRSFDVVRYGEYETVHFRVQAAAGEPPLNFAAARMSDGTLRALAALLAAFQVHPHPGPSVVGIEEPETALHPAAMRALVDALGEATQRTQVLLTTHSGDLLADPDLDPSQVLVVRNRHGRTHLTPVDPASREIIRRELYTLADLQRLDQLDLDEADLGRQAASAGLNEET